MRKVNFLVLAQHELDDAYEALEYQKENQGHRFISEVKRMINLITRYPLSWNESSKSTRKCFIAGFSYAIIYDFSDSKVTIIGIMRLRKKPIHWATKSVSEYATCRISSLPEAIYTR